MLRIGLQVVERSDAYRLNGFPVTHDETKDENASVELQLDTRPRNPHRTCIFVA